MNKNILGYILVGFLAGLGVFLYQRAKYEDKSNPVTPPILETVNNAVESVSGSNGDYKNKGLTEFPKEILGNTQLTKLDLSGNDIESLPSEIGKLKNLQEIYIVDSGLRALPAEIRMFSKLRVLDVHDNDLTGIPAEIGQLPAIEKIDFSGNAVDALPNEIFNLTHLDELNLKGNPLSQDKINELRDRLPNTEVIF